MNADPSLQLAADPTVTVVIPMRNEACCIAGCLESVLASRLPPGITIEVLVFDGNSSDESPAIVAAMALRDERIRLLPNPERLQSAAFNRGLAVARGQYLVRMDAHSVYAPDYIAECLRLLESTGAGNVGGVQLATGSTWLTRAIAGAVSSRFAAGDAQYRNATGPGFTDTVYLGSWRTATLRELGGMRPDWAVNEDYELNVRLRAHGGKVYLSPSIRSTYQVRSSAARLAYQYARYGFWKVRTLVIHPASLRWRQVVAPAFVLSVLLTPLLVSRFGAWGVSHLMLYAAASVTASVIVARRAGADLLPLLPLVFFIIHFSWGSGFLAGLAWWPFRRA